MNFKNAKHICVVNILFDLFVICDFSLWGWGTRLWRPKEPGGGGSPRNPGRGQAGTAHRLLWYPVRTPYRQSLIGEKRDKGSGGIFPSSVHVVKVMQLGSQPEGALTPSMSLVCKVLPPSQEVKTTTLCKNGLLPCQEKTALYT